MAGLGSEIPDGETRTYSGNEGKSGQSQVTESEQIAPSGGHPMAEIEGDQEDHRHHCERDRENAKGPEQFAALIEFMVKVTIGTNSAPAADDILRFASPRGLGRRGIRIRACLGRAHHPEFRRINPKIAFRARPADGRLGAREDQGS